MSATKYRLLTVSTLILAVGLMNSQARAGESELMHHHAVQGMVQTQAAGQKPAVTSLQDIHGKQLPAIEDAIRKAIEHLQAGHAQAALAELKQAQKSLAVARQALGRHIAPQFVNTKCPIMGSPINPEKVTPNLVREYEGQKVAFCCGSCPLAWDKLSDAQKEAKLKVAAGPKQPMNEHHQR